MANIIHLEKILRSGGQVWNGWRKKHLDIRPDLSHADLCRADLSGHDLRRADLKGAHLWNANLSEADLSKSDLCGAYLNGAHLESANLHTANLNGAELIGADLIFSKFTEARLRKANLHGAQLLEADFRGADLREARLCDASLTRANFENANLAGCFVHGVSAWDVRLRGAIQTDLVITPDGECQITSDNLEVAQFMYLLLNGERLRYSLDAITSKFVLILGRFTPVRKRILAIIRQGLRRAGYVPVLFDFQKPSSRDVHETVTTLARLARFVIADITDPRSIPQELVSIVEQLPSLPIQPILLQGAKPWGMFDHLKRYPWVLPLRRYQTLRNPTLHLGRMIGPAERRLKRPGGSPRRPRSSRPTAT
jgi:uncharacterized protein YjbI with pentapeptide repeats